MSETEMMEKLLEIRIAIDVLEDVMLDELRKLETLLVDGPSKEALDLVRGMIHSVETEGIHETRDSATAE